MIKKLPEYVIRLMLMRETTMPGSAKTLYPFLADIPNLYSLNTLEKQSFSHVFKRYKTYSSTDNFLSPIPVSDWLIFPCINSMLCQNEK